MTGLGVAEAEDASVAEADAVAVSLGTADAVAAASLEACWPHAASRPLRPKSVPPLSRVRRVKTDSGPLVVLQSSVMVCMY